MTTDAIQQNAQRTDDLLKEIQALVGALETGISSQYKKHSALSGENAMEAKEALLDMDRHLAGVVAEIYGKFEQKQWLDENLPLSIAVAAMNLAV